MSLTFPEEEALRKDRNQTLGNTIINSAVLHIDQNDLNKGFTGIS